VAVTCHRHGQVWMTSHIRILPHAMEYKSMTLKTQFKTNHIRRQMKYR
jgi:hypothetical protein